MNNIKVAFFDTKPYDIETFKKSAPSYNINIDFYENKLNRETAKMAEGHEVVCAFVNDELNKYVIDILENIGVKLIAMRCAGFNNVDLKAACPKIKVVRVPEYSPYAVAEFALSLILCLNRKIHRSFNRVREGNFSLSGLTGFDIHEKTIGIIGTGKIGRAFTEAVSGFKPKILFYDPYPNNDFAAKYNGKYTTLEEIYHESDIISLHCPLTEENKYLISDSAIKQMKDGVMLINTSRGKLIDTKALINGLKNGKIGYAGLDVYEEEAEYFFEDRSDRAVADDTLARLMTFPNVLLTSHQAFLTKEALQNIAESTLNSIRDFKDGKELKNSICQNCPLKNCSKK